MNQANVKQLISDIIELADELKVGGANSDLAFGELLAYKTVLKRAQTYTAIHEQADYGLDFDIDDRYLN